MAHVAHQLLNVAYLLWFNAPFEILFFFQPNLDRSQTFETTIILVLIKNNNNLFCQIQIAIKCITLVGLSN